MKSIEYNPVLITQVELCSANVLPHDRSGVTTTGTWANT